jgi:RNA:NAD 2'-phosphotransferase (TPT1/KptA family)
MPLFPPRHELALLRARCGATGLPAPPLRRGRVVLYADRLTVAGWVGLRRHRWDVMLLDVAAARAVEGGLRIELADGSVFSLTLTAAAEWAARIAEYRACLGPLE